MAGGKSDKTDAVLLEAHHEKAGFSGKDHSAGTSMIPSDTKSEADSTAHDTHLFTVIAPQSDTDERDSRCLHYIKSSNP